MTKPNIDVTNPAIPGIGGRDTFERAVETVRATLSEVAGTYRAARQEIALRRGLSGLDRRLLHDMGIDRGSA